jgi:hypothetical protein
MCRGPIGVHVVGPELSCHHCGWALRSNAGDALVRGVLAGGVAAFIALGLAFCVSSLSGALWPWVEGAAFIGCAVGVFSYRRGLVLTPLRPQRDLHLKEDSACS